MDSETRREIEGINQWINGANGRLSIIESIVNEETYRNMIADAATIKRILNGDKDLNVPPLYDMISELNKTISKLKSYQEKDQEYHTDMKIIISGLIALHVITLILAVIGVLT